MKPCLPLPCCLTLLCIIQAYDLCQNLFYETLSKLCTYSSIIIIPCQNGAFFFFASFSSHVIIVHREPNSFCMFLQRGSGFCYTRSSQLLRFWENHLTSEQSFVYIMKYKTEIQSVCAQLNIGYAHISCKDSRLITAVACTLVKLKQ